jgi:hypothetical protein
MTGFLYKWLQKTITFYTKLIIALFCKHKDNFVCSTYISACCLGWLSWPLKTRGLGVQWQ